MATSPSLSVQTLLDTFAAKIVSKLSFITIGANKSANLEGKCTDKEVNVRVIDPSGSATSSSTNVGTDDGSLTFNDLKEKKVTLPMVHYYSAVRASVIDEAVSIGDANLQAHLDAEAMAVAEKIRKDAVKAYICKPNVAFVGGWEDIMSASGFIGGNVDGTIFGFINYKAKSKLAVSQPFGSQVGEKLYRVSEIGQGQDGSYFYNEKNLPTITLTADTFTASATISSGKITALTITGSTGTQTLPAGTPVTLKGLKACDCLGNVTDEDAVVILTEAVAPSSKVYTLTGKFEQPVLTGAGRQIADEDGTDAVSADITGAGIPDAGTYFVGLLKAQNFNTYASAEVKGKDGDFKSTVVDGIQICMNSVTDKTKVDMIDQYRFDCYLCSGIVDPRGTALVLVKK